MLITINKYISEIDVNHIKNYKEKKINGKKTIRDDCYYICTTKKSSIATFVKHGYRSKKRDYK